MPVLDAQGLKKAYGPRVLIEGATVTLRAGERVGLVGRNGSGKSTLARILAGLEGSDQGQVTRRRDSTVSYLEQAPTFSGDPTAHEAASAGLAGWQAALERYQWASRRVAEAACDADAALAAQAQAADEVERCGGWELEHRVSSMLTQLGVLEPSAKVKALSGGEQRRVALARLLLERADLAILDEPTNHLDADTVEWLEQYLSAEFPGAVLLITHDRYLLDRVAQRTLELSQGKLYSYDGGYERYLEQKAERALIAERTEQNRQNFLRRELEWLRRQPKARSTKQKARVERAEAAQSSRPERDVHTAALGLDVVRSGKTILELRGLVGGFPGKRLFGPLELFLTAGQRVGIVGPNGCGKTTLLRTLLGQLEPIEGSVTLGQNTKPSYFDQGRSGLDDSKSVFDGVMGDQTRVTLGNQVIEPRSYLKRFGFEVKDQSTPIAALSGGERARAALARTLREQTNLVLLDEPTNDLDVETLGALEGMLVDSDVTALVITHDRWFLDRVATSILAFESDGTVQHYPGNYQAFRRLRAARHRAPRIAAPDGERREAKPTPAARGRRRKLSSKEARELAQLPERIEALERDIEAIGATLGAPETYADGGRRVAGLERELAELRKEHDAAFARWEELETLQAELAARAD